jgi:flagellar biosynthesis protein
MADEKKPSAAVALSYDKDTDPAPRVSAKGRGPIAEQIIKVAKEHDVPIRQDAALVEILEKLDIDSLIPLEAYTAVAEILNYVYKVNAKARNKGAAS